MGIYILFRIEGIGTPSKGGIALQVGICFGKETEQVKYGLPSSRPMLLIKIVAFNTNWHMHKMPSPSSEEFSKKKCCHVHRNDTQ